MSLPVGPQIDQRALPSPMGWTKESPTFGPKNGYAFDVNGLTGLGEKLKPVPRTKKSRQGKTAVGIKLGF